MVSNAFIERGTYEFLWPNARYSIRFHRNIPDDKVRSFDYVSSFTLNDGSAYLIDEETNATMIYYNTDGTIDEEPLHEAGEFYIFKDLLNRLIAISSDNGRWVQGNVMVLVKIE